MRVSMHHPTKADASRHDMFCTLDFEKSDDGYDETVNLFLTAKQTDMARAIADIFNGNLDALTARISLAIPGFVEMPDGDVDFMAFAIACDLIGKDLDEALRERREAEDAA